MGGSARLGSPRSPAMSRSLPACLVPGPATPIPSALREPPPVAGPPRRNPGSVPTQTTIILKHATAPNGGSGVQAVAHRPRDWSLLVFPQPRQVCTWAACWPSTRARAGAIGTSTPWTWSWPLSGHFDQREAGQVDQRIEKLSALVPGHDVGRRWS
jgi:hypothetical protein